MKPFALGMRAGHSARRLVEMEKAWITSVGTEWWPTALGRSVEPGESGSRFSTADEERDELPLNPKLRRRERALAAVDSMMGIRESLATKALASCLRKALQFKHGFN
jgi:hypothetical protein